MSGAAAGAEDNSDGEDSDYIPRDESASKEDEKGNEINKKYESTRRR